MNQGIVTLIAWLGLLLFAGTLLWFVIRRR